MIETEVLIIGAGLAGLSLHYYLHRAGIQVYTVEARDRIGGRILTDYDKDHAPIELGATWFGEQHKSLKSLIEELGIEIFDQTYGDRAIYEPISTSPPQLVQLPSNDNPSYRVVGGTSRITEELKSHIPNEEIILSEPITQIISSNNYLQVQGAHRCFKAKMVVSTLPPNLFKQQIPVSPSLPSNFLDLMATTHTWMSTSIKIGLKYPQPFWREKHLSGTVFSNVGPVSELYDHSDSGDKRFALKGFLNNVYHVVSREERKEIVIKQLSKYYGSSITEDLEYIDKDWSKEIYTHVPYLNHVLPHQYNGHELYQNSYLDQKLFFGGTETSTRFPGYMEGAVYRSMEIFDSIKSRLSLSI